MDREPTMRAEPTSSDRRQNPENCAEDDRRTLEMDFARGPGLSRGEQTLVSRFASVLRFNDFMTALMVAATAFSAFATWRTAKVTNLLFNVAERPYIGVLDVRLERPGMTWDSAERSALTGQKDNDAHLIVDCRNFGHVQASDGVARVQVLIDGRLLPHQEGSLSTNNIGIVSPNVPHLLYRFIPLDVFKAVLGGKSRMVVHVMVNYRGPAGQAFCYNELMTYEPHSDRFIASGGSDRCDGEIY
jgi:hypothetical protein